MLYTILYHTITYRTIPYHTIPYHTIPYHTIPYHTKFKWRSDCLHVFINAGDEECDVVRVEVNPELESLIVEYNRLRVQPALQAQVRSLDCKMSFTHIITFHDCIVKYRVSQFSSCLPFSNHSWYFVWCSYRTFLSRTLKYTHDTDSGCENVIILVHTFATRTRVILFISLLTFQAASCGLHIDRVELGSIVLYLKAKSYQSKIALHHMCNSHPEFILKWLQNAINDQKLMLSVFGKNPVVKFSAKINWTVKGKKRDCSNLTTMVVDIQLRIRLHYI